MCILGPRRFFQHACAGDDYRIRSAPNLCRREQQFTFADEAPTSNALQVQSCLTSPSCLDAAASVVEAGFFDDDWQLPPVQ